MHPALYTLYVGGCEGLGQGQAQGGDAPGSSSHIPPSRVYDIPCPVLAAHPNLAHPNIYLKMYLKWTIKFTLKSQVPRCVAAYLKTKSF